MNYYYWYRRPLTSVTMHQGAVAHNLETSGLAHTGAPRRKPETLAQAVGTHWVTKALPSSSTSPRPPLVSVFIIIERGRVQSTLEYHAEPSSSSSSEHSGARPTVFGTSLGVGVFDPVGCMAMGPVPSTEHQHKERWMETSFFFLSFVRSINEA